MESQEPDGPSTHFGRPLSEIQEVSEPQLTTSASSRDVVQQDLPRRSSSVIVRPLNASNASIQSNHLPRRISSGKLQRRNSSTSILSTEKVLTDNPLPNESTNTVPERPRSISPVRKAVENDPVSCESSRLPSKTFVRTAPPVDILHYPTYRHHRVQMHVSVPSPLLVGGGTLDGQVRLTIDGGSGKLAKGFLGEMFVTRLSVDLLGVEEVHYHKKPLRRSVFLSIANELVTNQHPPPPNMAVPSSSIVGNASMWRLLPCIAMLPFCLNLPLNAGPPPCETKYGSIRYILSATLVLMSGDKWFYARESQSVIIVTVHDPETVLVGLPTPLTSTDEMEITHGYLCDTIKLTAGIHRQVWLSGLSVFIDVHVANNTDKTVRKIEIQLEKSVILFLTAAASTGEGSAGHLRIPDRTKSQIVRKVIKRKGSSGWTGILPKSQEVRTYELPVPPDEYSTGTATHFEVRYFVNVRISLQHSKNLKVSLPVILIHPNSVDVLPNAVEQVAAALANERRFPPGGGESARVFVPGRSFNAARRRSMLNQEDSTMIHDNDMSDLTERLNQSPRRTFSIKSNCTQRKQNVAVAQYSPAPKLPTSLSGIGIFQDIFDDPAGDKENIPPSSAPGLKKSTSVKRSGSVRFNS